jgi:16S rRNA (cytosine967-C5)-methyltransferase
LSARRAAADLLVAVLERGRTLEEALGATESFAALAGRDRAFARALATATLRRLGGLDAVLANFLERPLHESAFHARALLRLGAAQILLLGTPPHAAVGETVAAANEIKPALPFAKLINAVLRKVAAQGPALLAALPPGADLPAWLFTRWRAAYGAEAADAIALALHEEPPLDLTVKDDQAGWAEKLTGAVTPTGSVRLAQSSAVEDLPGYADGDWWVQDAAAALPARLLGDVRGLSVLDLCAAPGGKTLQLAAAGAQVTALDRSAERLERLRRNLARTNLDAEIVRADAFAYRPAEPFDAIMLDAPCTATGTLRRHPDVAWLRKPEDVRKVSALQRAMLDAAAAMLKPGGLLVYAVCSLEPEEGAGVTAAALQTGAWKRAPIAPDELGAPDLITPDGELRTLPAHWPEIGGMDGFYAVRLTRSSAG